MIILGGEVCRMVLFFSNKIDSVETCTNPERKKELVEVWRDIQEFTPLHLHCGWQMDKIKLCTYPEVILIVLISKLEKHQKGINMSSDGKSSNKEKEEPEEVLKWAAKKTQGFLVDIKQDELEKMYDDAAEQYDELTVTMKCNGAVEAVKTLTKHVTDRDVRILDVGCATGRTGEELYDKGFRDIHGVDMSAGLLKVADRKQVYAKLVKGVFDPSTPLHYDDGYFDVLICVGSFLPSHLNHTCLPEFIRLLKPGGIIAIAIRKNIFEEELSGIKLKSTLVTLTKDAVLEKVSHEEIGYMTENDVRVPGMTLFYKVRKQ